MQDNIDPVWEEKYKAGHTQRYPWDIVVSFVFRNAPKDINRGEVRVLEVGCGTGANLKFIANEGFKAYGIEGSRSAYMAAKDYFNDQNVVCNLALGDFSVLPYEDDFFHLIIDRASLSCVEPDICAKSVSEIHRVLKPGGRFLLNVYSDRHSSCRCVKGERYIEQVDKGSLAGCGGISFYSYVDICKFARAFKVVDINHMESIAMLHTSSEMHAEWRCVLEK